jgi:uncharacterized damage-inducible protein DinB
MGPDEFQDLFEYTYWAFDLVWDCITQLSDEQFTSDLAFSSGSIRDQVLHLIGGQQRWVDRMRGEAPSAYPETEMFATKESVRNIWDQAKQEFMGYVLSLDFDQLEEQVQYEIASRGVRTSTPRREILMHLANHATDHRAQILTILNLQFGIETPEQDMILYLWGRNVENQQ